MASKNKKGILDAVRCITFSRPPISPPPELSPSRFTPLFAVWRARSGVRVSRKPLVRATVYRATCIDWLTQRSRWERGATPEAAGRGEQPGQMLEVPVTQVQGRQRGLNTQRMAFFLFLVENIVRMMMYDVWLRNSNCVLINQRKHK